ncbi:MAG: molybdopterin-guanine dinucleotide biosynthesis protein B [Rhodocyclaceae bacterium]|nr:molybdopterin-guanine dinucleotide biosynthesis protein B [Rhodocyclaceae bacterium]
MKIFGIAGYSGSGKTTLLERLIPRLTARGLRVSVIKHAHHGFDIDRPGKDSYRHREAGASEVMLTGGERWALLHELRDEAEPTLAGYLAHFSPCDLVLVEGFKNEPVPKLEVHRPANGKPPLWPENPNVVAVATDAPGEARLPAYLPAHLPILDLNDVEAIADFVVDTLNLQGKTDAPV